MIRARLFRALSLVAVLGVLTTNGAAAATLRVIDGDTLVLDGQTIRLDGIDAPELSQSCQDAAGRTTRCGQQSKKFLERLTRSGPVSCRGDEADGYGRRIATCFSGQTNVNAAMIQAGQAFAFRRYSMRYAGDEDAARSTRSGLWSGKAEAPWDYRKSKWQTADQRAPAGCPIKGNISDRGRIYHTPWSPSYARTRITEARGERWFCSEAEALAAGWRAPS